MKSYNRSCPHCSGWFSTESKTTLYCSPACYIEGRVVKSPTGCWESKHLNGKQGYGVGCWDGKHHATHRFSYVTFIGPLEPGIQVRHKCDNRKCCNPDHLETGNAADNVRDWMTRHEKPHVCKLDATEAAAVYLSNEPRKQLAERYGVTIGTIQHIKNGDTWTHVTAGLTRP